MKTMFYSIHVPWGWIKQRPHFVAEELSKYFEVTVFEKKVQKPGASATLPTQRQKGIMYKAFNAVPLYNPLRKKCYVFDLINRLFIRISADIKKYDYVWITSIKYYALLKDHIRDNQIIVYDCMDDELAFPSIASNQNLQYNLTLCEKELIKRANYIICSSDNLKNVILNRTGINKDILVVNNATAFPSFDSQISEYNVSFNKNTKAIVYIGTVAKWFDFESILSLLNNNSDTELYLFGPIDCDVPKHDRINIMGSCEHKDIWSIMKQSDILIMPFKLNPLIMSVNPVKLYEYIWSRKPVISIEYPESLRFSDFVYYYSENSSLDIVYKQIKEGGFKPKSQDAIQIANFLQNNSWNRRVKDIVAYIS